MKTVALILLSLYCIYSTVLNIIDYRARNNEIPSNVSDIYDKKTYLTWKNYKAELCLVDIFKDILSFVMMFVLIFFNVHSKVLGLFNTDSVLGELVIIIGFQMLAEAVLGTVFSYIRNMKIEQKYGFNKMTAKIFWSDQIKELLIGFIITTALLFLFATLHIKLGNWILLVFTCCAVVILFAVTFLYPKLNRIYNKFKPLEDGELKDKLNNLLTKHGYQVKAIEVMDASKRSTKSNAYFTGYGKLKTIVLYDTLVQSMTADEICAVFAHELGHGLNKDTLKNSFRSILLISLMVLIGWVLISMPSIYSDFGFTKVNYSFAFILLSEFVLPVLAPAINSITSLFSRKAEYQADAFAVSEGYGEALVSGLKKLAHDNFSDLAPAKIIVALSYSHPTMSQRIEAIEKTSKSKGV